jgi:hypothetical protein
VTDSGKPQRYTGAYVDRPVPSPLLGTAPMLGRDFTPADNTPGGEKVAIIGYGIWQRDFGGSPQVVGKGVRINGKPATIVGVMPQGFAFPQNEELWLPLYSEFPPKGAQGSREYQPVGHRPPQARRVARSGNRGIHDARQAFAEAYPTRTSSSTPAGSSR